MVFATATSWSPLSLPEMSQCRSPSKCLPYAANSIKDFQRVKSGQPRLHMPSPLKSASGGDQAQWEDHLHLKSDKLIGPSATQNCLQFPYLAVFNPNSCCVCLLFLECPTLHHSFCSVSWLQLIANTQLKHRLLQEVFPDPWGCIRCPSRCLA